MQKVAELEQIRNAISQTIFVVLLSMLAPLNDDAMWWAMNILSGNFPRKAAAAAGAGWREFPLGTTDRIWDLPSDSNPPFSFKNLRNTWKEKEKHMSNFETLHNFAQIAQLSTLCTILHFLHMLQNFALFAQICKYLQFFTTLHILQNFAYFVYFFTFCTFCTSKHLSN